MRAGRVPHRRELPDREDLHGQLHVHRLHHGHGVRVGLRREPPVRERRCASPATAGRPATARADASATRRVHVRPVRERRGLRRRYGAGQLCVSGSCIPGNCRMASAVRRGPGLRRQRLHVPDVRRATPSAWPATARITCAKAAPASPVSAARRPSARTASCATSPTTPAAPCATHARVRRPATASNHLCVERRLRLGHVPRRPRAAAARPDLQRETLHAASAARSDTACVGGLRPAAPVRRQRCASPASAACRPTARAGRSATRRRTPATRAAATPRAASIRRTARPRCASAGGCVTGDCHGSSADCPTGQLCGISSPNTCGGCSTDAQCTADPQYGAGHICFQGICQPGNCHGTSSDCTGRAGRLAVRRAERRTPAARARPIRSARPIRPTARRRSATRPPASRTAASASARCARAAAPCAANTGDFCCGGSCTPGNCCADADCAPLGLGLPVREQQLHRLLAGDRQQVLRRSRERQRRDARPAAAWSAASRTRAAASGP